MLRSYIQCNSRAFPVLQSQSSARFLRLCLSRRHQTKAPRMEAAIGETPRDDAINDMLQKNQGYEEARLSFFLEGGQLGIRAKPFRRGRWQVFGLWAGQNFGILVAIASQSFSGSVLMMAVVPNYRCGTVPESNRTSLLRRVHCFRQATGAHQRRIYGESCRWLCQEGRRGKNTMP